MVSKESEYLIHLAEEQLERLNKSLYFYQRNNEIQDDLLECSSERFDHESNQLSLTPIYAIIDRQRQEAHSRGASGSSTDLSPPRRKTKKIVSVPKPPHFRSSRMDINDNHIRDWRNGAKLVQRTLGPRKMSPNKCNCIQSPSDNRNAKEKLSTFWDYNGHRRAGKVSKSTCNMEKQDSVITKCCDRKNAYSRNEIRKYIREKQRSFKEKETESNLKAKGYKERTHSSLIKLNSDRSSDWKLLKVENDDHFCSKPDGRCQVSCFNQRKSRMNIPIYDELKGDGIFDYRGFRTIEGSRNISPYKLKNGFNSTVDSGIETGEWIQAMSPDALKIQNDLPYEPASYLPSKTLRETTWKKESKPRTPITNKSKNEYYNILQKEFKDGISAYDASSENDVYNDRELTYQKLTPSPSPYMLSDNGMKSPIQNLTQLRSMFDGPEYYIQSNGTTGKLQIIDGKLSISLPNCYAEFSPQSSLRNSKGDFRSPESSQVCIVDELKDALLDAQKRLNPENYETTESLSERISKAVQNFMKTQAKSIGSRNSPNGDIKENSCHSKEMENNSKTVQIKSEYSRRKGENKKDHLSTECEATEIEFEHCKQVNKIVDNDLSSVLRHEIKEQISEEKNSLSLSSDQSEIIDDVLKANITTNLATKTKELHTRREQAKELIKLTKEYKKENKRVKLLEKKACQFSTQYLQDCIINKKSHESTDCTKPNLGNICIAKYPRHAIPPDGKDSGRSDTKENFEHQLSPRVKSTKVIEEMNKDDNYPTDNAGLSEVDEITTSISEVTTTLSDRSELEARLVALRAEMEKKHQLVDLLKVRQKEMKRDKIKQKEIILQKQIDMYDDYISKLQENIAQLDTKLDDVASDDSHTLTGSTTNINELKNDEEITNAENRESTFDDLYLQCVEDQQDIGDICLDTMLDENLAFDDGIALEVDKQNCVSKDVEAGTIKELEPDTKPEATVIKQGLLNKADEKMQFEILEDKDEINEDKEIDVKTESGILEDHCHEIENKETGDIAVKIEREILKNIDDENENKETNEVVEKIESGILKEKDDENDNKEAIEVGEEMVSGILQDKDDEIQHIKLTEFEELVQIHSVDNNIADDVDVNLLYMKEVNLTVADENEDTILDDLLSENVLIESRENDVQYQVTVGIIPDSLEDPEKHKYSDSPEKKQKELEDQRIERQRIKENDTTTEIFILEDEEVDISCDNSNRGTISYSIENNSAIKQSVDEFQPNIQVTSLSRRNTIDESNNEKLIPSTNNDDIEADNSSISDTNSVNFDSINNLIDGDWRLDIKTALEPFNNNQLESLAATDITSPVPVDKALISFSESNLTSPKEIEPKNELLNLVEIEHIVDSLLHTMIYSEIERLNLQIAHVGLEKKTLLSVAEIVDFQSTSFITPQITIMLPAKEEKPEAPDMVPKSEDLCEFTNVTTNRTSVTIDTQLSSNKESEPTAKIPELISIMDEDLLNEKIKWLIPLERQYLDSHIDSAILHFYHAKQNAHHGIVEEALLDASQTLPTMYIDSEPVVTNTEISAALFDSSKQHPYIDKRIIFHLIKEIFSEIYSSERYLPQMPWIHSSFMVKRKNYTTWKGDKPPESFDLVSDIVRDHIYRLLNQKNIFREDVGPKSRENSSHSKITKWCIDRQKDQVDKILINDLRKEENDWVYYDEAEEEVKIQIAEDVFNFLITDTISWLKSTLSQT